MATFRFQTIESPPNVRYSYATGISGSGVVVGYYWDDSGGEYVFRNSGGTYSYLPYPSNAYIIHPYGINSIGNVAGIYGTFDGEQHGFYYTSSTGYTLLDNPAAGPDGFTDAFGINDAGKIVGCFGDGMRTYGFIFDSTRGTYTTLVDPHSTVETIAYGINSKNEVVGSYDNGSHHGFFYSGGNFTTLDAPGASASTGGTEAVGINAAGQIVGVYYDAAGLRHGFLYDHGVYQTIDDPLGSFGTVLTGINDQGSIVGYYFDSTGTHGFVAKQGLAPRVEIHQVDGSSLHLSGANGGDLYFRIHLTGSTSQSFTVTLLPNAPSTDPLLADGTDAHYGADWILESNIIQFGPSDFAGPVGVVNANGSILNADGSVDHLVKVHVQEDSAGADAAERYFGLGIADSSDYSTDARTNTATGVVYGPVYSPVKVDVRGLEEGTNLTAMLKRDFQAAVDRFVAAVGPGKLETITVQVEFVTFPSPATLASTSRETLVTKPASVYKSLSPTADVTGDDFVAIPNLLLEYRNGETVKGSVDWIIKLDKAVLRDKWYNGSDSSVYATTILTHELLHAAGFGQEDTLDIPEPAWSTHIVDDLLKYYRLGQNKIPLTGTNAVDGGNHLDKAGDLMNPQITGRDIKISELDISILRDFGYSSSASIQGAGAHASHVFYQASIDFKITSDGAGGLIATSALTPKTNLSAIEFLRFTDKTIFVENADNANIARLYSAALDRAPDIGGLSGWEDIYASNISAAAKANGVYFALAQTNNGFGTSIAGGFTQSNEFKSKYGPLDDAGFLTQLYLNVLDRTPASAELSGWLEYMHGPAHFSREMVLVGFAESPENIAKTAADWLIQI